MSMHASHFTLRATLRTVAFFIATGGIWIADTLVGSNRTVAQRSGGMTDEFLQTYGLALKTLADELHVAPLVIDPDDDPIVIKSGPLLLEDAQKTLADGNMPLAMELLFAHTVTEYEQAERSLKAVRFSRHLRRPVWQIRWGVSLAVRGDDVEDANPIGGTNSGRVGSRQGTNDQETDPREVLESSLGLVATFVGEAFEKRMRQSRFGSAMDLLESAESEPPDSRSSASIRSRSSDKPVESNETSAAVPILESGPAPPPVWYPGIVFLGEGSSGDRLADAQRMGLDFLLHFDVALKTDRNDKVINTSRCRVIQVSGGRIMGVTQAIDADEADRFSRSGKGDDRDYIEQQSTLILAIMDQKANVDEMPSLTKEIARKRVGMLMSASRLPGATRPSLRTLAEIRMYQSRGLLDASEVDTAFDYVGGSDALFLLHGPLDERLDRARQWAVDALARPIEP